MTVGRNATLMFVVTALMIGAVTMSGCGERSTEPGDAPGSEAVSPSDVSDENTTGDDSETASETIPATSSPVISDSELDALAAELAAMESQLDALVLPDDDFSDIEELLD